MILWWLACTGPTLVTEALPSARVGTRYAAVIETRGRKPTFSADGLPEGLALHPELGLISGVPRAPGVATVTVRIARDEVVDERTYVLEVGGAERGCDVAWSGTFTEGALRDDGTLDGDAGGGWAADVLPIPGPSIDRVDFEVIGAQLFLVEPGRPFVLGEALSDQAEALRPRTIDGATTLSLGFDTRPHLGAHQAVAEDPTLVVASAEPGAWSVRTTCVPGPVISSLRRGPFRLGDRVITGFGVTRPDPEVAVAALDPLPQGLALTPNGLLTGTAEQAGDHSFRIQVTGGDGRQTVGVARVGIIEPVRLACGETRPLATARASSDLAEVGQIALIEADWADHVALAFTVDAGPTARVRVVPSDLRLVAPLPADLAVVEGPAFVELAPDSWPDAAYYQRWPQARLVLDDPAGPATGTVRLDCDDGPRLDAAGLPVLDAGRSLRLTLPIAGGTPPVRVTADGLPDSVELDANGTVEHDGTDFGTVDLTLTLTDADDVTTTVVLPFYASTQAACGPDALVLRCGDEVPDGAARVCLEATDLSGADWVAVGFRGETRDDLGLLPPGRLEVEPTPFVARRTLIRTRGDGTPLADLDAWNGLPLAFDLASDDPSPMCVRCGTGSLPNGLLDDCDP